MQDAATPAGTPSAEPLLLSTPNRYIKLSLRFVSQSSHNLTACLLYKPPKKNCSDILGLAIADIEQCYVRYDRYSGCSLWIGSASFDIRAEDVEKVTRQFDIRLCDDRPQEAKA